MASIPLALLAEYAVAHSDDNRLYVMGGGIRSLSFASFPASRSRLALALGLEFPQTNVPTRHVLRIESSGPTDEPPMRSLTASFVLPPAEMVDDQPVYFHFAYNIENVKFPAEGLYVFAIVIDEERLAELPLQVLKTPGAASPEERLNEGYLAYNRGDSTAALEIFKDITLQFPRFPGGYNNLGFVLLAEGNAAAALEAFAKARELGFGQPEILDANVACAQYLLGDPTAALQHFQRCIQDHGFNAEAVLFGVNGRELFLVHLQSASDYVSLMTLNAGWSALWAEDPARAARYLVGAEAAELGGSDDERGKQFALSVRALKAMLTGDERLKPQ